LYIKMKLLLSKELGRLATWLRILGLDAEYFRQQNLSSLVIQALRDDRVIITRNQHLARRSGMRIVVLESEKIKEQIAEVLKALNIGVNKDIIFSRCIICNLPLVSVEKETIKDKVPEYVFKTQETFVTCPACQRIYWQGTHWGNINEILKEAGANNE